MAIFSKIGGWHSKTIDMCIYIYIYIYIWNYDLDQYLTAQTLGSIKNAKFRGVKNWVPSLGDFQIPRRDINIQNPAGNHWRSAVRRILSEGSVSAWETWQWIWAKLMCWKKRIPSDASCSSFRSIFFWVSVKFVWLSSDSLGTSLAAWWQKWAWAVLANPEPTPIPSPNAMGDVAKSFGLWKFPTSGVANGLGGGSGTPSSPRSK